LNEDNLHGPDNGTNFSSLRRRASNTSKRKQTKSLNTWWCTAAWKLLAMSFCVGTATTPHTNKLTAIAKYVHTMTMMDLFGRVRCGRLFGQVWPGRPASASYLKTNQRGSRRALFTVQSAKSHSATRHSCGSSFTRTGEKNDRRRRLTGCRDGKTSRWRSCRAVGGGCYLDDGLLS
jgi:hypothetical protein